MACAKSVGDLWFLVTAVGVQPCGEGPVALATGVIRHIATLAMPSVFYCVHRLGRVSYLTTCSRQRWDMNNQIAGIWDDILAMARVFYGAFWDCRTGNVIGKGQRKLKWSGMEMEANKGVECVENSFCCKGRSLFGCKYCFVMWWNVLIVIGRDNDNEKREPNYSEKFSW